MKIFFQKNKIIFLFLFLLFIFSIKTSNSYAIDYSLLRCNSNDECRRGFVCINGTGDNLQKSSALDYYKYQTGCCEPMLVLRQICLFHNLLSGTIAHIVVTLVLISMGLSFLLGKVDHKKIITLFVGIVCIYGSYQLVALMSGYDYIVCELVDTDYAPGEGCNTYSSSSSSSTSTTPTTPASTTTPTSTP